jgi:hypothetical protein
MRLLFKLGLKIIGMGCVIFMATNIFASDKELLDTLLENGVLTQAQHEKLMSQAQQKIAKKMRTVVPPSILDKEWKWASRIKISGDMRVRYEDKQSDRKGVHENRQRIRARLAIAAKINQEVNVGFRLVTAGGRRSSNQDLEGRFVGKRIFFDRAFIDWHPNFAPGTHIIAGKMPQPWYSLKQGLIWDTDVNPEGLAVTYQQQFEIFKIKASAGYFIVDDGKHLVANLTENNGFSEDQKLFHGGVSGEVKFTETVKASVGFNTYIYDDAMGNHTNNLNTDAELYELAGKLDIKTYFMPIKLYAQYVINAAAIDAHQNVAWLAGIGTQYKQISLNYNYRDTQEDAVIDSLNDSDFAVGNTASRGHKIKLGYKLSKNFSTYLTYYAAKEYGRHNIDGNDVNVLHVDLKAKF